MGRPLLIPVATCPQKQGSATRWFRGFLRRRRLFRFVPAPAPADVRLSPAWLAACNRVFEAMTHREAALVTHWVSYTYTAYLRDPTLQGTDLPAVTDINALLYEWGNILRPMVAAAPTAEAFVADVARLTTASITGQGRRVLRAFYKAGGEDSLRNVLAAVTGQDAFAKDGPDTRAVAFLGALSPPGAAALQAQRVARVDRELPTHVLFHLLDYIDGFVGAGRVADLFHSAVPPEALATFVASWARAGEAGRLEAFVRGVSPWFRFSVHYRPVIMAYIETLQELIATRFPPLPAPLVVYRGVRETTSSRRRDGKWTGLISTTARAAVAYGYTRYPQSLETGAGSACCLLEVTLPAGLRVLPVLGLTEDYADSMEIMLPSGLSVAWSPGQGRGRVVDVAGKGPVRVFQVAVQLPSLKKNEDLSP